jgi:hypothetical protein
MIKTGSAALAVLCIASLAACGGSSPSNNFGATLNGASEVPPTTSSGTGTATVTVSGTTATYTVSFTGLSGNASASHIHVGAVGTAVAGNVIVAFSGVPANTSGNFTGTFTSADVKAQTNPPISTFDDVVAQMRAGNTYVNIHSTVNGGGEIRGQLAAK